MKVLSAAIFILLIEPGVYAQPTLFGNFQNEQAPKADKQQHLMQQNGDVRDDNYYWLKTRDSDAVVKYLNEENAYFNKIMKPTEQLQDKLYNEMLGRIKQDDNSVPYLKNGYYYYTRYEVGKQYPIFCRKKDSEAAHEEVLVDANVVAIGHAYCVVTGINVSPD